MGGNLYLFHFAAGKVFPVEFLFPLSRVRTVEKVPLSVKTEIEAGYTVSRLVLIPEMDMIRVRIHSIDTESVQVC